MKKIIFTVIIFFSFIKVFALENIKINNESLSPYFETNIRKYNFIKFFEDLHPEKILLSEAGYGLGHGDKDMSLIYYKKTK